MQIVSISMIRNESDILETFVRYHLQFIDQMIIINHRSVDSSAHILQCLQKEGLPIEVLEENCIDYQQSRLMTQLLKKAVHHYKADWVLPLDADEFLVASGKENVREVLGNLPQNHVTKILWRNYAPLPDDDINELNVLKRIQNYINYEKTKLYKILIPRSLGVKKRGVVGAGNHSYLKKRLIPKKMKQYSSIFTDKLALAHFPVRSAEQIMLKAFATWLAILAKPEKEPTEGFHIKLLFDRFVKNDQMKAEELTTIALNYTSHEMLSLNSNIITREPVRPENGDFELLYNFSYASKPLPFVARIAEEFAESLASARRNDFTNKFLKRISIKQ